MIRKPRVLICQMICFDKRHALTCQSHLCNLCYCDNIGMIITGDLQIRARILLQVTIYRRLLIGRDVHLDQSKAYDIW